MTDRDDAAQSPESDRAAYWSQVGSLRHVDALFPFLGLVLLLAATFVVPSLAPELRDLDGFPSWEVLRWVVGIVAAQTAVPVVAFLVSWRVRHVNWKHGQTQSGRDAI